MKTAIFSLFLVAIVGCNESGGSANLGAAPGLGVELSDTECRQVYAALDLWAISGQANGTQVYRSEIECINDMPTLFDAGSSQHVEYDFDASGFPNLVMEFSYLNNVAYINAYEE